MKKRVAALLLALLLCLTPALAAEERSQSGKVVIYALGQMGYTEGVDEYTVFGAWYGIPRGYWCDMFVSWCASRAGVRTSAFPHAASCTQHVRLFSAMGRYQPSAARGGSYMPLQGDLVLLQNPETGATHHVGLVLYVEDGMLFTVEGNALTKRWDYPAETVAEAQDGSTEPPDYVTCNMYSLTDPRLHGYAVPAYASREPLELEGFVDLGRYEDAWDEIRAVVSAGMMRGTSSHTFFPRAGMSRGEFLRAVMSYFGFEGWEAAVPAFDDVPTDHPCYGDIMAARSIGLIPENGENTFAPDIWISGEDAQFILSALRARLGLEDRVFPFTPGDLSDILTPYTTRGDIARAFCALIEDAGVIPA